MATAFTPILQRAVESVPGAVGAIFADTEGEAVDHFAADKAHDLLILGAHYGVILNQVQSALHLFHFGEASEMLLHHARMDLVVRAVADGYYVVLAARGQVHLASALRAIARCADELSAEM